MVTITVWWRVAAAVNVTQPPTFYTFRVCQDEMGVDGWVNKTEDFTQETKVCVRINWHIMFDMLTNCLSVLQCNELYVMAAGSTKYDAIFNISGVVV